MENILPGYGFNPLLSSGEDTGIESCTGAAVSIRIFHI
jgi:hypothetical protein